MKPQGKTGHDTNGIGDISEMQIATRFLQLGYTVFIPYGGGQRADLIIEDVRGKFWRIQCKSARLVQDGTALEFDTASHNVTGNNRQKRHYREDCDFFALYNATLNTFYLVPVNEVGVARAHLRLTFPKNKNQHGYRMAKDYEL